MNLKAQLTGKRYDQIKWPIKPSLPPAPPGRLYARPLMEVLLPITKHLPFLDPACDTDNESLGCCAVENGCRRVQMDDFKVTGKFRNLRHADIYRAACQAIHGNQIDEGFELGELVQFLMDERIMKHDCVVAEVGLTPEEMHKALDIAPLICGQYAVGIMPDELSPDGLGWADESGARSANFILDAGGHCILLGAEIRSKALPCHVYKNGGWGGYGLNHEGILCTTVWWTIRTALASPLLVTHPSGNIVGPNYETWLVKE